MDETETPRTLPDRAHGAATHLGSGSSAPGKPGPPDYSTQLAEERTAMGFDRTHFAAARTLMAWIRTAVSLISFGFTIAKAGEYFAALAKQGVLKRVQDPQAFGTLMVAAGVVLLLGATVEYLLYMRRLSRQYQRPFPLSIALFAALLIAGLGVFSLVTLLLGSFLG